MAWTATSLMDTGATYPSRKRGITLFAVMVIAAWLGFALQPTEDPVRRANAPDLKVLIPSKFGDWRVEDQAPALMVNPRQELLIHTIYSQTLERSYVNSQGDRIMLSIAYGGHYDRNMETHKPEICYPAQGFQVSDSSPVRLDFPGGWSVPATRLVARSGTRNEPLTYWLVLAGQPTRFGLAMRIQQIRVGLTGYIPDGLLFRASTILDDSKKGFELDDQFVRDLVAALPPSARDQILGKRA